MCTGIFLTIVTFVFFGLHQVPTQTTLSRGNVSTFPTCQSKFFVPSTCKPFQSKGNLTPSYIRGNLKPYQVRGNLKPYSIRGNSKLWSSRSNVQVYRRIFNQNKRLLYKVLVRIGFIWSLYFAVLFFLIGTVEKLFPDDPPKFFREDLDEQEEAANLKGRIIENSFPGSTVTIHQKMYVQKPSSAGTMHQMFVQKCLWTNDADGSINQVVVSNIQ